MSLSDLASLGSFVSGVAVLASLVFLFFQMRQMNAQVAQNTKHARAQLFQGSATRAMNMFLTLANKDMAAAWVRGNGANDTPEAVTQRQFECLCNAFYINWDDVVVQHREGLLDHEEFSRLSDALVFFLSVSPGVRGAFKWVTETGPDSERNAFFRDAIARAEAVVAPT